MMNPLPSNEIPYLNTERYSYNSYNEPKNHLSHPPQQSQKLHEISIKVESVRESLHEAIEKTIERGEKIEETSKKAMDLEERSRDFYQGSRDLKCLFFKKNMRTILCWVFLILSVIVIISIIVSEGK